MIQLNKNYSLPERLAEFIPIKIVSVGGAGLNALDRIVLDGLERADVVAINTDVHSLTSSVATRKVQLGRSVSRGLGAGGDPDVGYQAALESADEIREALTDSQCDFHLCRARWWHRVRRGAVHCASGPRMPERWSSLL